MSWIKKMLIRHRLQRCGIKVQSGDIFGRHLVIDLESPLKFSASNFSQLATEAKEYVPRVGAHTYVRSECNFGSFQAIGRYCSIARGVICGATNHEISELSTSPTMYLEQRNDGGGRPAPKIGHDVWIGNRAIILRGVTIGDGAVIGAGAVVTHDVQPYEIVGGVPARHLRYRFSPECIAALLELRWWDCDPAEVRRHLRGTIEETIASLRAADLPAWQPPCWRLDCRRGSVERLPDNKRG